MTHEEYYKYLGCLEENYNLKSVFFEIFSIWLCEGLFIDNLDIIIKKGGWVEKGRFFQLYFYDDDPFYDDYDHFNDKNLSFSEGTVLALFYIDPYEEYNVVTFQELYKYLEVTCDFYVKHNPKDKEIIKEKMNRIYDVLVKSDNNKSL